MSHLVPLMFTIIFSAARGYDSWADTHRASWIVPHRGCILCECCRDYTISVKTRKRYPCVLWILLFVQGLWFPVGRGWSPDINMAVSRAPMPLTHENGKTFPMFRLREMTENVNPSFLPRYLQPRTIPQQRPHHQEVGLTCPCSAVYNNLPLSFSCVQ